MIDHLTYSPAVKHCAMAAPITIILYMQQLDILQYSSNPICQQQHKESPVHFKFLPHLKSSYPLFTPSLPPFTLELRCNPFKSFCLPAESFNEDVCRGELHLYRYVGLFKYLWLAWKWNVWFNSGFTGSIQITIWSEVQVDYHYRDRFNEWKWMNE